MTTNPPEAPLDLFEQAPGFVAFLRGPEMVFELANAAYHQLVGHRGVVGKPIREALPEVAGQGYFELLEEVRRSGQPFVGSFMRVNLQRSPSKALEEAYVDFIYQPIRGASGDVVGILVQGHDVTDKKREQDARLLAERALRASEERYRTLFESIDQGYCLMQMLVDESGKTRDYRFLEANAAFEAQTGLQGALGKTARELVPDLDDSWFQLYGKVAQTGEPARFENHAPAMHRWFDVFAHRVGPPEQLLVALVFKDITERKRAEEERERLHEAEKHARLEAERASRLKDEFLATVSHELRTPLSTVMGWSTLLRNGAVAEPRRQHAYETIERGARAQLQLIDDLLDVSRVVTGKLRLSVQPVDFPQVVKEAVETLRFAAEAKGIQVRTVLDPDAGWTMGDPDRLRQVVWNLFSNAIKFTPKGGRVSVVLRREASSVALVVEDTGQGIAADFLPFLFERFRQESQGTSRAQPGLGLGLAIVKHLVEAHGGTVQADSPGPGQGATFLVRIPIAPLRVLEDLPPSAARAELRSAERLSCPPELAGLRVLVVDDEPDTRELLRSVLEQCSIQVTVAASAQEAFERFVAFPPEVLVSDIGMPEEDGYSLIRRIRKLAPDAGGRIPAIALTAYARSQDRTRALLDGFTNHTTKPVDPQELLAVVAAVSARNTPA